MHASTCIIIYINFALFEKTWPMQHFWQNNIYNEEHIKLKCFMEEFFLVSKPRSFIFYLFFIIISNVFQDKKAVVVFEDIDDTNFYDEFPISRL